MAAKKPSGKIYRYYVINKKMQQGAKAAQSWNYLAKVLEDGVTEKLLEYLRSDQMVLTHWKQIKQANPSIEDPQTVVTLLRRTADIWDQYFAPLKTEIVKNLIERVIIKPNGVEVLMRFEALGDFVKMIHMPNTTDKKTETEA
jgi:hypothetical protein